MKGYVYSANFSYDDTIEFTAVVKNTPENKALIEKWLDEDTDIKVQEDN